MRFFRNYANYALRAELCDFASAHNSGRSVFTIKSKSSRCLQCNDGLYLESSNSKMLKTFGAWSFQAAAPRLWNRPHEIRLIKSLHKFKKAIKTFLFYEAFSNQ